MPPPAATSSLSAHTSAQQLNSGLRARLRRWFWQRMPQRDSHHMVHGNLYILPTGAGAMLAVTLVAQLLLSINYQLNLGYLFTFIVAGCAVSSIAITFLNLRGLHLHLLPPTSSFANQPVTIDIHIHNPGKRPCYGMGLLALSEQSANALGNVQAHASRRIWINCAAGSHAHSQITWLAPGRGWHYLPVIHVETRYPLGISRLWSLWRPAAQVLIYPTPEADAPPLPRHGSAQPDDVIETHSSHTLAIPDDMPDELRPYQRGDSPRRIVWKKAAQTGELVTRESRHISSGTLWLDLALAGTEHGLEAALQRLCAWVLQAHEEGLRFGLHLSASSQVPPDEGDAHLHACLQALAEYGTARPVA